MKTDHGIKIYFAICTQCGDKRYPHVNKENWMGITVHEGVCPFCKEKKMLVPISDWEGHGD